jgi:L-aspartate oxidase
LLLGLEAAHGRRRIVHAGGDRSGSEIMRALIAAVRQTPSITVLDGVEARRLLVADGRVAGVLAASATETLVLPASRVVIATGGLGGLYRHTTNPLGALGQGVALAARAGAVLADMEFVQFHPTALDVGLDPMPLVSEAVRGEGAVLIDESGGRFTDELKPRDQVSRAVWRHLGDGHPVFLDAREALGTRFAARFPAIAAHCRAAGLDPARDAIPVRPAVHYHMGGIAVDAEGRSTVPGLWAAGEVAATGLHGANRLASNSLLEAAVCGRWVDPRARRAARAHGDRRSDRAIAGTGFRRRAGGRSGGGGPCRRRRGAGARGEPRRALAQRFSHPLGSARTPVAVAPRRARCDPSQRAGRARAGSRRRLSP